MSQKEVKTENNPLLLNSQAASQVLQTQTTAHLMHNHWQFWYYSRAQQQLELPFRDQLKSLGTIPTIEHFFNYYVYLKKPTDMPRDIDLFFFREKNMPMWEDSPNGGVWIVKLGKEDNIDKMW